MLNSNRPLPDQLADVRAAIATLKEKEKTIREQMVKALELIGIDYNATVSTSEQTFVNSRLLRTMVEPAIFDACSKTTEVTRVYLHKKGRSK